MYDAWNTAKQPSAFADDMYSLHDNIIAASITAAAAAEEEKEEISK